MKKKLIASTFILVAISFIAKILSFLVRILLARKLSSDAMNYYTLAAPTMVFCITLAQMGIPGALSKVVAQSNNTKKPLVVSIFLSLANNICLCIIYALCIPFLAQYVLKQKELTPILYAILPLIPLVSISGILKGYLLGIQKHISANVCQLFEEVSRILFLYLMFVSYPYMDVMTMAKVAMYSISVGEACSCLYMLYTLNIPMKTIKQLPASFQQLQRQQLYEILSVSLPITGSRFIGSLTYFLEPIIMVIGLTSLQADEMVQAYGQLNAYILPIITMPSFLTITLSNFLLPSFTYHYTRKRYKHAQKLFTTILITCFLVGMGFSALCFLYPEQLMQIFYHKTQGAILLKQLAIPFSLYSLQPVLSSMLHALSLSKQSVMDTFIGSITRLTILFLFASSMQSSILPIALTIGMLVTTIMHAIRLSVALQHNT